MKVSMAERQAQEEESALAPSRRVPHLPILSTTQPNLFERVAHSINMSHHVLVLISWSKTEAGTRLCIYIITTACVGGGRENEGIHRRRWRPIEGTTTSNDCIYFIRWLRRRSSKTSTFDAWCSAQSLRIEETEERARKSQRHRDRHSKTHTQSFASRPSPTHP